MAVRDMKTAISLLALSLVSAPAAAQSTPTVKDRNGCEVHNGWPDFNCLDALAAKRARKPGGILLASGFEEVEVDRVQAVLPAAREVRRKGSWALMVV